MQDRLIPAQSQPQPQARISPALAAARRAGKGLQAWEWAVGGMALLIIVFWVLFYLLLPEDVVPKALHVYLYVYGGVLSWLQIPALFALLAVMAMVGVRRYRLRGEG